MLMHVGVDSGSAAIQAVVVPPPNTVAVAALGALLHGKEVRVNGERAGKSHGEIAPVKALPAEDSTKRQCRWKHYVDEAVNAKNRHTSRTRARVGRAIGVVKRVSAFTMVRYRGLPKNGNRVFAPAAPAAFFLLRHALRGAVRSQGGKE
jgi:hypothetical protein